MRTIPVDNDRRRRSSLTIPNVLSSLRIASVPVLLWLVTAGLPTSLGVVLAATIWGRFEPLTGFDGFLGLAAGLGVPCQVIAFLALSRRVASARARGRSWRWRRILAGSGVLAVFAGAALWLTHRPPASLAGVIDGHAHLFGDEGWPPVHKQTCGLSSAQKANQSYGLLTKLLRLPPTGDLNELYVEALVRQARNT